MNKKQAAKAIFKKSTPIGRIQFNINGAKADTLPNSLAYKSSITLFLEGISFKSQGNTKFRYRLKGVDENWIVSNSIK